MILQGIFMQELETKKTETTLSSAITNLVDRHIERLGKNNVHNLYALTLESVEHALFKAVLEFSRYNQSRAAKYLGLSRGTFRTRLVAYFGDSYVGKRPRETDD